MPSTITTSIVIAFQDPEAAAEANASLTAEVDNREDGLNAGRTQFVYGDSPAFLVYRTSNVNYSIETTDGVAASAGQGTVAVDEVISFVESTESSLSKPPTGAVTYTILAGRGISSVDEIQEFGVKVIVPEKSLAVVRAQYISTFEAYRLSGVADPNIDGLDEYPVIVYIAGTVG